jgi:hypothetical protein
VNDFRSYIFSQTCEECSTSFFDSTKSLTYFDYGHALTVNTASGYVMKTYESWDGLCLGAAGSTQLCVDVLDYETTQKITQRDWTTDFTAEAGQIGGLLGLGYDKDGLHGFLA